MYRTALRTAARPALRTLRSTPASRRLASSTAPANRPRTWKGSLARWGFVAAAVYYYNTSPVFADEAGARTIDAPPSFNDSELPTVDSVLEEKRKQIQARLERKHEASPADKVEAPAASATSAEAVAAGEGVGALEEEADQQGAFNPETGEINWDCPCLGGMAHGPCGEEFKTAFSCFVYSTEEPKGMDCIEKFQGMQECFREYPDIYGAELSAEEEAAEDLDAQSAAQKVDDEATTATAPAQNNEESYQKIREDSTPSSAAVLSQNSTKAHEENEAAPAKWSDATAANDEVKRQKPKDAKREA